MNNSFTLSNNRKRKIVDVKSAAKKHIFRDKNIIEIMMKSIDDKIIDIIKKCVRGNVFTPVDFANYARTKHLTTCDIRPLYKIFPVLYNFRAINADTFAK